MKRTAKHGRGSLVYDTRRNVWQYFWYEAGKRHSKVLGTRLDYPTKASCWRTIEAEHPPLVTTTEQPTLREVAERFKAERMSNRHSHRRVSCSFLKNHVLPRWGATPIDRVQAREVELWLKATSLQPKTKAHLRSILSSLIDFAMWSNLIPAKLNPMSLVRIQGVSKRARKPRILTVDEFHQLVDQMREPSRTIALVCVCLGLRISEALALRWEDVDWLGSKLSVRRAIVEQHVDEPKTAGSTATFPLSAELLSKLQLWRRSTEFSADSDWMFASPVKIGRLPYSYTGVWRVLQEAARKANLGKLGTHSFRHTYRSWLGSVGTPLEVQQKAMRHTDLRTTMIYGSVEDGRIDEALEKVSSLVFANSTQTARRSS